MLERFAYFRSWPEELASTLGHLRLPSGQWLATIERPWLKNEAIVSCVPEGVYSMNKRVSPVVKRSTRGAYSVGWEVRAVPNRSYIMIHPGNWATDTEGCIVVGLQHGILKGRLAVLNSGVAFKVLMTELENEHAHELHIRPFLAK